MTLEAGYCNCACRDCFEIAIRSEGDADALCLDCQEAGCEPHAERECEAPGAYGGDEQDDQCGFHAAGGNGRCSYCEDGDDGEREYSQDGPEHDEATLRPR